MKLSAISEALGTRIENGLPATEIDDVAGIEEAGPGQLTFVANVKYTAAAKSSRASAVIVAEDFPAIATTMLRSKNPYFAWAKAVELFHPPLRYAPGVHPTAVVDPAAKIGKNAHIGPYVVIGAGAEIGDDAVILAHVVIYRAVKIGNRFFAHAHAVVREFCRLGDNVILQNGAIVGCDGFGFAKDDQGHWHKIVQPGQVIIEDSVEVQANTCIDRASVGETRIARGAKLDNLVQVGHSCKVGEDSLLCAQVGLAGSTEVGKNVILAGQVGVAGHCTVGDGVIATAQSGIPHDVAAGKVVSGTPALDNRVWLKCSAVYPRLPEMAKVVSKLSRNR